MRGQRPAEIKALRLVAAVLAQVVQLFRRFHAFRRDELMTFATALQGDRVPGVSLTLLPAPKKATGPKRPSAA